VGSPREAKSQLDGKVEEKTTKCKEAVCRLGSSAPGWRVLRFERTRRALLDQRWSSEAKVDRKRARNRRFLPF
jgi:hypothetical protein